MIIHLKPLSESYAVQHRRRIKGTSGSMWTTWMDLNVGLLSPESAAMIKDQNERSWGGEDREFRIVKRSDVLVEMA